MPVLFNNAAAGNILATSILCLVNCKKMQILPLAEFFITLQFARFLIWQCYIFYLLIWKRF